MTDRQLSEPQPREFGSPCSARSMSCMACDLASGRKSLPGGQLHRTHHWLVEHCIGPLGLGTLIVKPERHVTSVADLSDAEAAELGGLLRLAAHVATRLVDADQVYTCLWSHARAVPGHIHYVVQPVTAEQVAATGLHGPALQMKMFGDNQTPPDNDITETARRARVLFEEIAHPRS